MSLRVLHVLSQRPGLTGSGVTLDAMVRQAARTGWQQAVAVGVPSDEPVPQVGGLPPDAVHPLRFGGTGHSEGLDFPVPGMSDVMPYRSSIWSHLTASQLERYRLAWRRHLSTLIAAFRPDIIHSHHVWLVLSLLKDIAPDVPVATTCHSTGLRQMTLTPHLAAEVRQGCARIERFCVLRDDHGQTLRHSLQLGAERVAVVGAGYRPELFHTDAATASRATDLLYIGKYSQAKGLPWLLDAFTQLRADRPELRLHLAGGGSGPEADELRQRLAGMAPAVIQHGQLAQTDLARLMRRCGVCILPSFYEGVPLVLVEAAACGCQLVATDLPGVRERLAPHLGPHLQVVPLPGLQTLDRPVAADLPLFVTHLAAATTRAVERATATRPPDAELASFTWQAVFSRIEKIWLNLTDCRA